MEKVEFLTFNYGNNNNIVNDTHIQYFDFDNCLFAKKMTDKIFYQCTFKNCTFNTLCGFAGSTFYECIFENCLFLNIDFETVEFDNSKFINTNISQCYNFTYNTPNYSLMINSI